MKGGFIMWIKKRTSLLVFIGFIFMFLFVAQPIQAAEKVAQTPEEAYRQFLSEKVGHKKYFQIVNIGHKNAATLLVGKGEKEVVNGKICFRDCKVYIFSGGQVKKMKAFKDYGGRLISLREKNGKYYLCNGGSDFASFYRVKNETVVTREYYNCHSGKGEDRVMKSVFKVNGKVTKDLGYLKASKYEKCRDSYKFVQTAISFMKNTDANRKSIVK